MSYVLMFLAFVVIYVAAVIVARKLIRRANELNEFTRDPKAKLPTPRKKGKRY